MMPLSEHEQRMLDDLERRLSADDPRLVRTFVDATRPRRDRRRIIGGAVVVLVGLALLVLAVSLPMVWLGVAAFLVMLAGAVLAVTAPHVSRGGGADSAPDRTPSGPTQPKGGRDFMRRLEDRWEKRSGDDHHR